MLDLSWHPLLLLLLLRLCDHDLPQIHLDVAHVIVQGTIPKHVVDMPIDRIGLVSYKTLSETMI